MNTQASSSQDETTVEREQASLGVTKEPQAERARLAQEIEFRQRAERQLRGLAEAGVAVSRARAIETIIQDITERARTLIGAHQAVTSYTVVNDWANSITGLSLSEKCDDAYAQYLKKSKGLDGTGIYAMVCETNQAVRMTQAELEAHPRWRGFGLESRIHPRLRGWLAAPLVGHEGENFGLIQLSDKFDEEEFTAEDEAVLVQLARLTSEAIEVRRTQDLLEERVAERTRALQQAHQELAMTAAQLALPARGENFGERQYHLEDFSLAEMMHCGAFIRSLGARLSREDLPRSLVRYLYDHLIDAQGSRGSILVRLFETSRFEDLPAELQDIARNSQPDIEADACCLRLTATAGDEPEWNDVRESRHHRVIPLSSGEAVNRLPMVSQLIGQLGLEVGGVHVCNPRPEMLLGGGDVSVFYVADAPNSPCIPQQHEFVKPYGVRSVVGFGDQLPDGEFFAVIIFAKVCISSASAKLLGHLALSSRMALLAQRRSANQTEAQILSLDRLLRNYERIVSEQEQHLHQTMARLAASNADLEQFAYVASHDLQEPLRAVASYCQLLERRYSNELDDKARQWIQHAVEGAVRMRTLILDLLEYSRVDRKGSPFAAADVAHAVGQAVDNLSTAIEETGATVRYDRLPNLTVDFGQLSRLFQNLIGNALKYHGNDPPRIEVTAVDQGNHWQFAVADNGLGIEPQYFDRIFVIFQRLHTRGEYPGTGIGLAVCKRIVERHGGRMWVTSTPGQGSTFYFTISKQLAANS